MLPLPFPFLLRPMVVDDVQAVMAIEQVVKSSPWTAAAYTAELANPQATAVVLTAAGTITGYMVFWLVAGEIQIHTIATAEVWRGRGLGAAMLHNALWLGRQQGATMATLEVRHSNHAAQTLYQRYGFVVVGQRPHYYRDNGETALLMTAEPLRDDLLDQQWPTLQQRLGELGHHHL